MFSSLDHISEAASGKIANYWPSCSHQRAEEVIIFSIPGLALVPDLAPGPGPADAATALAPAVVATAGKS